MAKLTEFQKSTITLLDYLYFYDILAMRTFSEDKLLIYGRIVSLIDSISCKRFAREIEIEYYKHLLIVGMDFELTFGESNLLQPSVGHKEMCNKYRCYLTSQIQKAGFNFDNYVSDLKHLLIQIPINGIGVVAAFKIVSQILYYEYDNITIGVFRKFLDYKFITISRFHACLDDQDVIKLFHRAMFLLEFEIFKNNLIMEFYAEEQYVDLNNLDNYKKIVEIIKARGKAQSLMSVEYNGYYAVKSPNDLKKFLINVEERLGHNPIFSDSLTGWVGMIGAWYLTREKMNDFDKPLFKESPTYIVDSGISCAKIARKKLLDNGFVITEKTIFDYYDRLYEIYRIIFIRAEDLMGKSSWNFHGQKLTHNFFYNPKAGLYFNKQLKQAMEKLHPTK